MIIFGEPFDEPVDRSEDDEHQSLKNEVRYLREEAYAVRDCFTRYSVQVLTAAGAIMVVIAKFEADDHVLGLLGFVPVVLLLAVLGMGMHKYATSNRLLGYELHLQRTGHYRSRDGWHPVMRRVGWEEAMRAWRIVQPTLYERIYRPNSRLGRRLWHVTAQPVANQPWLADRLPNRRQSSQTGPQAQAGAASYSSWFDQFQFLKNYEHVRYSAGGYLRSFMITFFMSIGIFCLMPVSSLGLLWLEYSCVIPSGTGAPSASLLFNVVITAIVLSICMVIFLRCINLRSRIGILEDGLLSIHSCSIVWEATVLAHVSALHSRRYYDRRGTTPRNMHGYTAALAEEAKSIAENCLDIHSWILNTRQRLYEEIDAMQWRG